MKGRQFGNYELLEPIGRGGMGEVWRATHVRLGRPAAVKLIRPEKLDGLGEMGPNALRRFEREAQATSRLKSPHTIEVYDFGRADDGTFYYAMELLDGLDLNSLVERYGPLPAERVVFLLRQACESLEEAHRTGLVHRDIKPANLFVCRLGLKVDFVKVLDFGLVKLSPDSGWEASQLTTDGMALGSPAYLAPEIAIGGAPIDARSDIYSLGCAAYWLLTGQLVFTADTPLGVVLAHVDKDPDPPSTRVELPIPPALEALVLDCLRKKPDDRPSSVHELSDQLGELEVSPPWTEERAHRWWQRHHPAASGSAEPRRLGPRSSTPSEPLSVSPDDAPSSEIETDEPDRARLSDDEIEQERERTLHVLQDAFVHSRLDVDELSRRTELVQHAASPVQLDALVADLERRSPQGALVRRGDDALARAGDAAAAEGALVPARRAKQNLVAFLGGVSRKGRWTPARKVRAFSFMGGADLDFRQAQLPPGLTEIRCYAFMGGVDVIVPPDLYVEVNGAAFMGGFDQSGRSEAPPPATDQPWLRIGGFALMGGVNVKVRPIRPAGEGLLTRWRRRLLGETKPTTPSSEDEPPD